ncbi:MAG: DUF1835 domain-containing protein [Rickettsia endosymbiont of Bryobia graminum]|nr:DUF1835 domain-containing protein [Rickettsia endosymbiont of Bryobia graminum]
MSLKYHIVCGHSAAGSLKLMITDFKLNNEHEQNIIIDLQDDLSMGSLSEIDVNPTTKNRFSLMYKYFDKILCEYDLFSEILENDIKLLPSLNISNPIELL